MAYPAVSPVASAACLHANASLPAPLPAGDFACSCVRLPRLGVLSTEHVVMPLLTTSVILATPPVERCARYVVMPFVTTSVILPTPLVERSARYLVIPLVMLKAPHVDPLVAHVVIPLVMLRGPRVEPSRVARLGLGYVEPSRVGVLRGVVIGGLCDPVELPCRVGFVQGHVPDEATVRPGESDKIANRSRTRAALRLSDGCAANQRST